ncbi:MAG: hypothetical protein P1U44_13195 [Vicingaceae bacterium]|nr:hypothetical protein [Vicingaceae bacterium]
MNRARSIIREEIQRLLFGHPIPNKEEKGYNPYWHDFETVFVRASHYGATSNVYEGLVVEIMALLDMESISSEEKIQQIKQVINQSEKEIRQLNREFRQDNKELRGK